MYHDGPNPYEIDKDAHYFMPMLPIRGIPGFIAYTSSTDRLKYTECVIIEDRYKVDDGFKVTLKALDEIYGTDTMYQSDFNGLLKSGFIIKKEKETAHVEEIFFIEPITPLGFLRHSYYDVVDN